MGIMENAPAHGHYHRPVPPHQGSKSSLILLACEPPEQLTIRQLFQSLFTPGGTKELAKLSVSHVISLSAESSFLTNTAADNQNKWQMFLGERGGVSPRFLRMIRVQEVTGGLTPPRSPSSEAVRQLLH